MGFNLAFKGLIRLDKKNTVHTYQNVSVTIKQSPPRKSQIVSRRSNMWNPSLKFDIKPKCGNCTDASQAGKHNFPLHKEDEARISHTHTHTHSDGFMAHNPFLCL